ncbi:ubiquinol--cytochrome-c reductase subunit 8 [Fusarium falciforme]|nr:ubiquinol--cytochrome-c reductase subunit 8 [Fusarium falciforme]
MRPTQILRSGNADPVNGHYLGNWGHFGGEKQRGIVTYGLSANRQNPWAGATHAAIFNTFRRTKSQIFYWLPPCWPVTTSWTGPSTVRNQFNRMFKSLVIAAL